MICLAARFSHSVPLSGKSFVVVSWVFFSKMESREQAARTTPSTTLGFSLLTILAR